MAKYAVFLRRNPNEARILFQELLIGVSGFFRDPKAFDVLKQGLLTRLKAKPSDYVFRVWIPGCSSGEEAYSVGIILRECLDTLKKKVQVQMFGTDIDLKAIERARSGIYPASISADVSAFRLARFFIRKDATYQVRQEIRQMVVFAPQNVIKDPPFIKLDLLCCRNLLIYLEPEIQKKLIPLFHYALRPDGILFLGSAETIGEAHDLFSALDRKWRIFFRREGAAGTRIDLPPLKFKDKIRPRLAPPEPARRPGKFNIPDIAARLILEKFAPPSVVVNGTGDILYVHGSTGRFLEPSTGEGGFMNILKMSREGLRLELMAALRKAAENKQDVDLEDVSIRVNGSTLRARVSIKVLDEQFGDEGLMLVVFQELAAQSPRPQSSRGGRDDKRDSRVDKLKRELQYTREYLQGTIEELETSNEELKSANEELQSTNEELQSTNEELETSQEELQSLNEEHVTLNSELQSRIDELTQSENDMKNLLESTEIAMIFVDSELRVTRFTSRATKIVKLIASDVGRPLADIVVNLCDETLIADAREVLRTLVPKEKEVRSKNGDCGHRYVMRMRPYRTIENVINGLVLTFIDIHAGS
jgi:two-component system CheB/CheR fusion protein